MGVLKSISANACSLAVTCWERADLLAKFYVMFSCVFVTFPYGVLCQVWYLIVWIPDFCPLSYFENIVTLCASRGTEIKLGSS